LRKVNIKFVMSVRPFFCPNRITILSLEGFKILYLIALTNRMDRFHVLLKSDKYNAFFP